jgi:hypothetical protein
MDAVINPVGADKNRDNEVVRVDSVNHRKGVEDPRVPPSKVLFGPGGVPLRLDDEEKEDGVEEQQPEEAARDGTVILWAMNLGT